MLERITPKPLPDAYDLNCSKEVFKMMGKWIPYGLLFGVIHIGWRWGVPGHQSALGYIFKCGANAGLLSAAYKAPQCYYHKKVQEQDGIGTMLGGLLVGSFIGFYRKSPASIIAYSAWGGFLGYMAEWSDFSVHGPMAKMTQERRIAFWENDFAFDSKGPQVQHAIKILDAYGEKYNQPSIFCFR